MESPTPVKPVAVASTRGIELPHRWRWSHPAKALGLCGLVVVGVVATPGCRTKVTPSESVVVVPEGFARSGAEALDGKWWEGFGDADLNRLVEEALGGNFSLRAAWDRLEKADARRRQAGAPLMPSLTAGVGSEYNWTQREEAGGGSRVRSGRQQSFRLVAEYEVDLWGRIRSLREAASLDQAASAEDLRAAAITLSAQVVQTWFELVEQRGQLALLDEQIQINEQTRDLIERRFGVGQAAATDLLQQRQLIESRRENRARAASRLRTLEISLAVLLGRTADQTDFPNGSSLTVLPVLPETGVPSELLQRRPDVRSAFLQVQAADQRVAAALADRYPRLSLVATYSTTARNWDDLFDNWIASVAGNLVGPIIDGGSRRAEVRRTRAVAAERVNLYSQRILEALADVEEALASEELEREVVQRIEQQLAIARDVQNRTLNQYLAGSESYLRVLDSQLSLQGLERELLTARRQLLATRVALCRALAGGWELNDPTRAEDSEKGTSPADQYPLPL